MDDERKSSKAGKRAAEGLREATAEEEAKNESKMGHDLVLLSHPAESVCRI